MENNTDKVDELVNIFNTYRTDVSSAVKKGTISEDRFDLQDKLYNILGELNISLLDMQNNDYINKLAFGPDDKTYLVIKNIESQIEDVFEKKTDKNIKEIYKEKNDYIDGLSEQQKKRYKDLMNDPLFYLLLGGTFEPQGDVTSVINEREFADDILKNKEKQEKFQETLGYIKDYRKACKEADTENDLVVEGVNFIQQLMNNIGFAGMSFNTEMLFPEKYQKFIKMIGYSLKDQELIKDPIISGIIGGSPSFKYKDVQMVDDEILAKAIVESL